MEQGRVHEVRYVAHGSFLAAAATAGDTVLSLEDAVDFNEDGGVLLLNDTQYAYVSADLAVETITLEEPLDVDYEEAAEVVVLPRVSELYAAVVLADETEAMTVRVPHALYDRLPEGIREAWARENVLVETEDEGELYIHDVLGTPPLIDGSFVDTGGMDLPDPMVPDSEAPANSPAPTAVGGIGSIFVRWAPIENRNPVTYEVHMSAVQGFEPGAGTLVTETGGGSMNVRTLPDGTALTYGTTYYFKVVAKDMDGAADPSNEASAQMMQVTGPDIAATYGYFGTISVSQLTGGTLASDVLLSAAIRTAETGGRVELDASGVNIFRPDGTPTTVLSTVGSSTFKGDVEAEGLTVYNGMTIHGDANEVAMGAVLRLATGITKSNQAPSVIVDWAQTPLLDSNGLPWPTPGSLSGLTRTPDGKWLAADTAEAKLHKWNADGTFVASVTVDMAVSSAAQVTSSGAYYGISRTGSQAYLHRLTEQSIFSETFANLTAWTSSYGTRAASGGQAVISATVGNTSGVKRTLSASMKSKSVQTKVTVPAGLPSSQETYMEVANSSSNRARIAVAGGQIKFDLVSGGTLTTVSIAYNGSTHRYWRITEVNGVLYYATSSDATNWIQRRSATHGFSDSTLNSMTLDLGTNNPVPGNLLSDGGFETGTADFRSATDSTISRDTVYKRSGSGSLKAQRLGGGADRYGTKTVRLPVVGGRDYTLEFYARTASRVDYELRFYDTDGALVDTVSTRSTGVTGDGSTFVPVTIDDIEPDEDGTVEVTITIPSGFGTFHLDDATFYDSTAPGGSDDVSFDDAKFLMAKVVAALPFTVATTNQTPVVGTDGTNLYVAEFDDPGNRYIIRTIDPGLLPAVTATVNTGTSAGFTGPALAVLKGSHDFGADRFVVATNANVNVFNASGAYQTNQAFSPIDGGTKGMAWDGTNFYTLGSNGALYKHTSYTWTTESSAWKAGFTWFDGGTQETPLSNTNAFTMKKRARLTVTSPSLPAGTDVDRVKVYLSRGTDPAYYQATTAVNATTVTLTTFTFSGAQPPSTSTFSAGDAASIRSTNDEMVLNADGTALIKGLIAYATADANMLPGNRPAIITGSTSGQHLRIDGNEVQSIASDDGTTVTPGNLILNQGGGETRVHGLQAVPVTGAITRSAAPYAKLYRSATGSWAANTTAVVPLVLDEETDATMGDTANNRIVAPITGIYMVIASVEWAIGAGARREITLMKNGTAVCTQKMDGTTGVTGQTNQVYWMGRLTSGEALSMTAYQNSTGGALNMIGGINSGTFLTARWMQP